MTERILRVKVILRGVAKPPVWRRLLVPAGFRLDRMHNAIQAAMGWQDYHLHVCGDGSHQYGVPDRELGFRDERKTSGWAWNRHRSLGRRASTSVRRMRHSTSLPLSSRLAPGPVAGYRTHVGLGSFPQPS